LEQERGLPDPGIAPDERDAAEDDAAAEDPVELADSSRYAREFVGGDLG
jgi:hypothetical protein